ncbi:hypothetical protein AABD41_01425 [Staphylococcus pseudoxylosus]|uniref:hypothetical protein n=1 Tax=Staphylococcus pseudoxylosus TaxID=2282419 RepID=UPI00398B1397
MNEDKYVLTENEIFTMRREIFKSRESIHRVMIPYGVITYIENLNESLNKKSKILMTYIGILLTFREAYYTYRLHHMNIFNIIDLMGQRRSNNTLNKYFSKNSFLSKNNYISHINDYPVIYNMSYIESEGQQKYFVNYKMASEPKDIQHNDNRPKKSIEPTLHVKGVTRRRGRGIQVLEEPLDIKPRQSTSFRYETISKVVSGEITSEAFYILCVLKKMTGGNNTNVNNKFQTSKKVLSKRFKVNDKTFNKYYKELRDNPDINIKLYSKAQKVEGMHGSKSYLQYDCENY